jgi:ribosomal protein S18 acetylase RimI-like enzyme
MNENSHIELRSLQLNDIVDCMLLSGTEGWNQTEKDWQLLKDNPHNICLVAESNNHIIGTATAMNYSDEIVWIGMMLVDRAFRGRGISKMLLSGLLSQLDSFRSVKLDATPAGLPVYEKFGFKEEYIIHRMTILSIDNFQPFDSGITPERVLFSDMNEVAALDASVFGAGRTFLIKSLVNEKPESAWCIKNNGRIKAFALGRHGRKYQQIGQVFASSLKEVKVLISYIIGKYARLPVVVDVLADKRELINWLNGIGFTRQRDFVRMYLHTNPCPGITENQFLICGPEFG